MGEVYRAKDTRLDRSVAIKILPAEFSSDPVRKQRFEREAKTISNLNHPHICVLYDVGHQDGTDYLVMECVEGETLAKRLEKGPLPLEQVLRYGSQIAEALDKAHRSGVVHRDLKPGNIMLTPTGAKLLDFGLAKPAVALVSGSTLTVAARPSPMTQEGTIVGTFQYMSPEQVEGKEVDTRSDLFSVGAVLYEMLTGKRAFEGKSQFSVASAILEREPTAITSIKPLTPAALDHSVRRCLAKDLDDRWQNSRDLAGELKWIAEGSSQSASPVSRAPRGKLREILLGSLAATFALAAIVLGYSYFRRPPAQSSLLATSLLPPENTAFDTGYALSPDGTRLVFSARSVEGKLSLWLRHLDSLVTQELSNTDGATLPFWSPDSQWIAFFAGGKLRKIPAVGGDVQSICDVTTGRGGSWNSHGVIVFAPSISGPLFRVSANGGTPAQVTQLDSSTGETTHRYPSFLPDGEHFLYLARQTSESKPHNVYVGSLNSTTRTKVLEETSDAKYAAPGYLLFLSKSTVYAQHFDAQTLRVTGESTALATNVARVAGDLWSGMNVSSAGQLVYRSNGGAPDTELITMDASGQIVTTLPTEDGVAGLRFSPDGRKLAVSQANISGM
jgi:serine/threonine protein kinase